MKHLLYLLSIVIFCSCSSPSTIEDFKSRSIDYTHVICSDNITGASILCADDSILFLAHSMQSPLLRRYDIQGDSIVEHSGAITLGNGHNEIITLLMNSVDMPNKRMYFYESNFKKGLKVSFNADSLEISEFNLFNNDSLQVLRFATGHASGFIATCLNLNKKDKAGFVSLFPYDNGVPMLLKNVGTSKMQSCTIHDQLFYAPNSMVLVQPGGDKCLFVSNVGLYAEIFELQDNQAVNKKTIVNEVPDYELDEHGRLENATNNLKMGFIVSATPSHIYLAPSRMVWQDMKSIRAGRMPDKFEGPANGVDYVDEVWICDWNGEIKEKLSLSRGIYNFVVTHEDKNLWGISEDDNNEQIVVRYDLGK